MPKAFTAEQFAAAAAAGEPRTEDSFDGDLYAWRDYQVSWLATFWTWGERLPPACDPKRRLRWTAATRHHAKIVAAAAKAAERSVNLRPQTRHLQARSLWPAASRSESGFASPTTGW